MKLYLLTNRNNGKRYVGLSFGSEDPVEHHRRHKVIKSLHEDIKAGDKFDTTVLLAPRSLSVAERMEKIYIETMKPEYNE